MRFPRIARYGERADTLPDRACRALKGGSAGMKRSLFAELSRRNVFRAALLYIGAVWALAQGIAQLGPAFGMPEWGTRWFVIACALGFPFWLACAWYFALTPEGLKREREFDGGGRPARRIGRDVDFAIIGLLSVAVVLLLTDRFVLHRGMGDVGGTDASIAVLPFVDMSPARDQEYFSDGVAEELLNLLSSNPQLKVAARTSSFSFKGRQIEIPEIARQLHVAHVLEGSVRRSGDRVRITAQLIQAADGFHLWSATYERELDDIFKVQDEIAADVARQLNVTLLGASTTTTPTTDPRAYGRYLQARQLGRQFTAAAFTQSDALYREVLAIDPHYPPAWVGLARNLVNETSMGMLTYQQGFATAREAVGQALAIDPDYAPAHASLGWIAMYGDNDLTVAARELGRALELDPTDLEIRGNASALLVSLGRLDDALEIREAVVDRDPVNVTSLYNLGITQLWAGRLDEATATFRTVLSLSPGRGGAHYYLGLALLLRGDAATALTEIEQESSEFLRMYGLPMAYHALGRKSDADAVLAELIEKDATDSACNIAAVYAFRGQTDQAFQWLDRAVENQDTALAEIGAEILFTNLRSDPRWVPLLRRLGKAPDQLARIRFAVAPPPTLAQR